MRGRLVLLFILCALLIVLRVIPGDVIQTMASGEYLIWVDMRAMNLTLYKEQTQVGRWPVAVGKGETPTPIGVFKINKRFAPDGGGFGTRFLGLNVPWGMYGIHGTDKPGSIGSYASHGCIRMFSKDVEKLYSIVPNWTTVVIEDGPYGQLGYDLSTLRKGDRGSKVVAAQKRLWQLGYYQGGFDGVYGPAMSAALKNLKKDHGLPEEDLIDRATWDAMGVILFE